MDIISKPSPNFNERPQGQIPDLLLLHYTGMKTGAEALERMRDPAAKVAAHYMIETDGTVYQLVAEDKRAWHAGISSWQGETDINGCSIGIEIVNPGHEFGYQAFPDGQMQSVATLCKAIIQKYSIRADRVLGHSDVAPDRKMDPGEKFNWQWLASEGVGLWPKDTQENTVHENDKITLKYGDVGVQVDALQAQMTAIGYGLDVSSRYDRMTEYGVAAFQRHWRQQKVSGVADGETQNLIEAILKAKV